MAMLNNQMVYHISHMISQLWLILYFRKCPGQLHRVATVSYVRSVPGNGAGFWGGAGGVGWAYHLLLHLHTSLGWGGLG